MLKKSWSNIVIIVISASDSFSTMALYKSIYLLTYILTYPRRSPVGEVGDIVAVSSVHPSMRVYVCVWVCVWQLFSTVTRIRAIQALFIFYSLHTCFDTCILTLLPAGSARMAALPVLFLLTSQFCFFCPTGATRCTDQGEIWQAPAKFHLDWFCDGGLRPENWKKIGILPI